MRHVFTKEAPQVTLPLTAPVDLKFTLTEPPNWRPQRNAATRLFHLRTGPGKPRLTEVAELKIGGNGVAVVELSGFGNKQAEWREPLKFERPADGRYTFQYRAGAVVVNGHEAETHLEPEDGVALEGQFGFATPSSSLVSPEGFVLDVEEPGSGVTLPPPPPQPPQPSPQPKPDPQPDPRQDDATNEFVAELKALALRYATRKLDPQLMLLLQLALLSLSKR